MISIPRRQDYADTNVRLLGLLDQMTRTEQAERMNALQRAQVARNMGLADIAAQEMNRSTSKGVRGMTAADFSVAGRGLAGQMRGSMEPPQEVSMSDKMQVAMQAANQEMAKQGGYGTGLLEEAKTGFGPKARALMEKLPRSAYEREGPIDMQPQGEEYTDAKAAAAQKRIAQVENSQAKYESMKARNMQSSPVSAQAIDQYDYYFDSLNKARLSGNPGAIRDAKNDLVLKWRMLDNMFGWNMSAGLKDLLAERPSGGVGGGKKVLWKERGSERKQYLPEGQVPKDSENWVPIDSEDSSALRRDLVKLDEQIAAARAANDEKTLSTLMARRRQLEGKTPETKQNFVARMDNSLINPYLSYQSGDDLDTRNVADNTPANKNQPVAQPKIKYKEGYEYEVNGVRMVYQNGRLRKL